MTIYGEHVSEFRPRPGAAALLLVSSSAVILSAFASSLFLSLGEFFALRSWGSSSWFIHAPLARQPLISAAALTPFDLPLSLLLSAALLGLTLLLFYFAPIERSLATRLGFDTAMLAVIATGVLPQAMELILPLTMRTGLGARVPVAALTLVAISIFFVVRIERRIVETLQNLFTVETPMERARLWLLRLPAPFLALLALAMANRDFTFASACAVTLVVTLLENLAHRPRDHYQELLRPQMREAAATLPVFALATLALSIWMFGGPATRIEPRALVMKADRTRLEPVSRLEIAKRKATVKPEGPEEEKKIEINWSKRP
ncbi:MAG TPA: hypothetical protein VNM92_05405 [Thermoanaerobaculia bacterium]|nr:hypothetical protein [Thermoanaerobaculia bacterium]